MLNKYTVIKKKLSGYISPSRLEHSLGTGEMAAMLADKYGEDSKRAFLAGLLHDCAREIESQVLLEIAENEDLPVSEAERLMPVLLHGPVGAVVAHNMFDITENAILRAIEIHTTGSRYMTILDKIIFVADKLEKTRNYPGVEALRELAFSNLNECVLACLEQSIRYILERRLYLHLATCEARNEILQELWENK